MPLTGDNKDDAKKLLSPTRIALLPKAPSPPVSCSLRRPLERFCVQVDRPPLESRPCVFCVRSQALGWRGRGAPSCGGAGVHKGGRWHPPCPEKRGGGKRCGKVLEGRAPFTRSSSVHSFAVSSPSPSPGSHQPSSLSVDLALLGLFVCVLDSTCR